MKKILLTAIVLTTIISISYAQRYDPSGRQMTPSQKMDKYFKIGRAHV